MNQPEKKNPFCTFTEEQLKFFEFRFLQTYLYALSTGALTDEKAKVTSFRALSSFNGCAVVAPMVSSIDEDGLANSLITSVLNGILSTAVVGTEARSS